MICNSLHIRLVFWSRIASISLYLLELKDLSERLTPLGMQPLAENVQGIIVPNSGHYIAEEQPQFVINQLSSFFGRNTTTIVSGNTHDRDQQQQAAIMTLSKE